MSEDKTQDITKKYDTKPTIETVLERIIAFEQAINARFDAFEQGINARFNTFEQGINARLHKFEARVEVRFDRIESEVKITHSEMFTLRADFRELKNALEDHLPTT